MKLAGSNRAADIQVIESLSDEEVQTLIDLSGKLGLDFLNAAPRTVSFSRTRVSRDSSRLLRAKISFASGELSRVADTLWNHPDIRTVYPNYLFCNHAVVRASVPVMRAALAAA